MYLSLCSHIVPWLRKNMLPDLHEFLLSFAKEYLTSRRSVSMLFRFVTFPGGPCLCPFSDVFSHVCAICFLDVTEIFISAPNLLHRSISFVGPIACYCLSQLIKNTVSKSSIISFCSNA